MTTWAPKKLIKKKKNLGQALSMFQHPHKVGQLGPFLAHSSSGDSLLSSPPARPLLFLFPFCPLCLYCKVLSSITATNVSQYYLTSCMFLHALHASRPVCSLSTFLNISHLFFMHPVVLQLQVCLYQRK